MNILLINGNDSFLNAVKQSLDGGKFRLIISQGLDALADEIQKYRIDTAIINAAKGDPDIPDICKKIRQVRRGGYTSIILVTSRERASALPAQASSGADDFIVRPFAKEEFIARMEIAANLVKLNRGLTRAKKKIVKLVKEDPVTGLYNRRALLDEALRELGRAARKKNHVSAIIIRLLNHDHLLDLHGYNHFDLILGEIGQRLKSSCRPYDGIGKIDDGDFMLFLPDTGLEGAGMVSNRIMTALMGKSLYVKGNKVTIEAAIGAAELDSRSISDNRGVDRHIVNDLILEALTKKAELALKKAVRQGPDSIVLYSE